MKKLINQNLPPKTFTVSTLNDVKLDAIKLRKLALASSSGFPAGSHVVGRLQRMIKKDSLTSLLNSILHLRNITRLAADILNTVPGARVDKQQFVRSEILAYVQLQASLYGAQNLSVEDQDLIAYMIASTESPDNSWYLNFSTDDKNHIIQMHKLLSDLALTPASVKVKKGEGLTPYEVSSYEGTIADTMVVYDPAKETIVNLVETEKFKERVNAALSLADAANDSLIAETRVNDLYRNASNVLAISHVRLWDHVHALFMSVDLWNHWITPRTSTDASSNMERAKGLRNFSAYLHSLLMYSHFFSIEAFLATYDTIEETIVKFVPLPAHEVTRYEANVRKFDVLNARADVADVFAQFKAVKNPIVDSEITAFPIEFISVFGMSDALNAATAIANKLKLPRDITNLKALVNQEFNTLTLSHPVSKFDVVQDINQLIIIKGVVSNQLKEACNSISSGTPRFLSTDTLHDLATIGLKIDYPLATKISLSSDPIHSSPDEFEHGNLKYHRLLHASNYDSVRKGRKELLFDVDTATHFSNKLSTPVRVMKMLDNAKRLRDIIGEKEWSTMLPSYTYYSPEFFTTEQLQSSEIMVEKLFEALTNTNFDIIKRTIGNPYSQEIYATYLSGFALLYKVESGVFTKQTMDVASLVEGYGNPYGTTYANLERMQKKATIEQFVKITDNVYIRILDKIPAPSDNLIARTSFMINYPHYSYQAAKETVDVERWVLAPGLLNFCLAPADDMTYPEPILLDKRYAYLNDALLIQAEPLWKSIPKEDSVATVTINERPWNRLKYIENVYFRTITTYGSPADESVSVKIDEEQVDVTKLVKELEEAEKKINAEAPALHPSKASASIVTDNALPKVEHNNPPTEDLKPTDLASTSVTKTETSNAKKNKKK